MTNNFGFSYWAHDQYLLFCLVFFKFIILSTIMDLIGCNLLN
uniref:Uncharacterized protein n=1 Tax=Anguilla anguilla TaxID=7936 RepID=A0A0E9RD18_ANGAN